MWIYEKKLQYPVKIKTPNAATAKVIITQYGGPDGELGASIRYLSQRFAAITPESKAILNDVGISGRKMTTVKKLYCKGHGLYIWQFLSYPALLWINNANGTSNQPPIASCIAFSASLDENRLLVWPASRSASSSLQ